MSTFNEIFSKNFSKINISLTKDNGHYRFRILNMNTGVVPFEVISGINYPRFVYSTSDYERPNHTLTLSPVLGYFRFTFPWKNNKKDYEFGEDPDNQAPKYGGYLYAYEGGFPTSYAYHLGKKFRMKDGPFYYEFIDKFTLDKNQKWQLASSIKEEDFFVFRTHFTYITRTGIEQHTMASVRVNKMKYRPKMFQKTNFHLFDNVIYKLDIDFDDAVGEHVDDWKGGTYGISIPVSKADSKILDKSFDMNIMLPKILVNKFAEFNEKHEF